MGLCFIKVLFCFIYFSAASFDFCLATISRGLAMPSGIYSRHPGFQDENSGNFSMNVINVTGEGERLPGKLSTSLGATIMLVFVLEGLIGNAWILISVASNRKLWNVINLFISSLCVNDLLSICLIVAVIVDSYFWREWRAGEMLCKLNPEFTVAFVGSSLWHTALIAIHRYIVVVHNSLYKRLNMRLYVILALILTRAIPISVTVPGFNLETSGYVPKLLRCILLPSEKGRIISVTVIQIILPCAIVVLCYFFIFAFVYRVSRQIQASNLMLQKEIQITKMFGVIFLAIMGGFVPYSVVRNLDRDNQLPAEVYVAVSVFYAIATCSNPLVYGAMSCEIRNGCTTCLKSVLGISGCLRRTDFDMTADSAAPLAGVQNTNAEMVTFELTRQYNGGPENNDIPDDREKASL